MPQNKELIPKELEIDAEALAIYRQMLEAEATMTLFDRVDLACREAAATTGIEYSTWADAGRNPQPPKPPKNSWQVPSVYYREEQYGRANQQSAYAAG